MTRWEFWNQKEFADVYENIYIRALTEDWYNIVFTIVKEIDAVKSKSKKKILDIGCGEGHTTKQILDRIKGKYVCDLLEPNENALNTAEAFLTPEGNIGTVYPKTLAALKTEKKYDVIVTSHTNYYWSLNQKDYDNHLRKLLSLITENGKVLILTLPRESEHYSIMSRQIYPKFNHAQYIIGFYKKLGLKVKVDKFKMRMYVGDILTM